MRRKGYGNPSSNPDLFNFLVHEGQTHLRVSFPAREKSKHRARKSLIDGFDPSLGNQFSTYLVASLKELFKTVTKEFFRTSGISLYGSEDSDTGSLVNRLADQGTIMPEAAAAGGEFENKLHSVLDKLEPTVLGSGNQEISFDTAKLIKLRFAMRPYARQSNKMRNPNKILAYMNKHGIDQFCSNPNKRKISAKLIEQALDRAMK